MARFGNTVFNGMSKKIDPKKLPDNMASDCVNVDFDAGTLQGIHLPRTATTDLDSMKYQQDNANEISSATSTIFKSRSGGWMTFDDDVSVVESPIPDDQYDRFYVTGIATDSGYPRVFNGQTPTNDNFRLGVPKPASPPTVSADQATTLADVENPVSRAYTITYVTAYGEEGPPADVAAADIVDVYSDQTMQIQFGNAPNGYNIETIRVYRTDADGVFRFLVDYSNSGAGNTGNPIADTTADSGLGEENPSQTWLPPEQNMEGLTDMGNGILAGFYEQNLYFCERYLPHAWPTEYRLTVKYNIVALATLPTGLLVLTDGKPYLAQGVDPAGITLTELDIPQSCMNKSTVVDMGSSVYYASPDGLIEISASGSRNLTEGILTAEQWKASVATGFDYAAGNHEGKYVGLNKTNDDGFLFDPRGGKNAYTRLEGQSRYVTPSTGGTGSTSHWTKCLATFSDTSSEQLYFNDNGTLKSFANHGSRMSAEYTSKHFFFPRPINAGVGRVITDDPATPFYGQVQLYAADNTLQFDQAANLNFANDSGVENNVSTFRLASGYKTHTYYYKASVWYGIMDGATSYPNSPISFVEFAESPAELS